MKGFATALIALILYTTSDILVWQRIFETNELWQYDELYHSGWYVTLLGYLLVGFLHRDIRDKILHTVSLWVFSQNGTEDVLYYWMDGRTIPGRLHWLDHSTWFYLRPVTDVNILVNILLWSFMLFVLYWLMYGQIRTTPPQ